MRLKQVLITEGSGAISSLRHDAKKQPKEQILDDDHFVLAHMIERGVEGPTIIKGRRKPAYKSKRQEQQRQEAEAAAATVLRHRIADNERRYPQIFAQVRAPEFQGWYERVSGQQWDTRFEGDIEEMRYRIIVATRSAENNCEIDQ